MFQTDADGARKTNEFVGDNPRLVRISESVAGTVPLITSDKNSTVPILGPRRLLKSIRLRERPLAHRKEVISDNLDELLSLSIGQVNCSGKANDRNISSIQGKLQMVKNRKLFEKKRREIYLNGSQIENHDNLMDFSLNVFHYET